MELGPGVQKVGPRRIDPCPARAGAAPSPPRWMRAEKGPALPGSCAVLGFPPCPIPWPRTPRGAASRAPRVRVTSAAGRGAGLPQRVCVLGSARPRADRAGAPRRRAPGLLRCRL